MKKIFFLILLMVFVLPPLLADEARYFTCEELSQLGRQEAPTWSKRWFWAGCCITFVSTLLGTAVGLEGEEDDNLLTGFLAGAGVGAGISILLPLILTSPPSYQRTESAEFNKCYNDGYLRKARATNTGASFLGSLLGGPAVPVFAIGAIFVWLGGLILDS
jgi:hypothetical protein